MKKNIGLFLLLVLLLQSCTTFRNIDDSEVQYKVAAIGDSITYGLGIPKRQKNSYPAQLNVLLGTDWLVGNFGVNGATLIKNTRDSYWDTKQFHKALEFQPDIVIIKLGTNDSKSENWIFKDHFINDYIELVQTFKKLDSKPKVYICYPVPAFSHRWGIIDRVIREDILKMIDIVSVETEVPIIDLYSHLSDQSELFPDSIHPDSRGALLIAQKIYSFLVKDTK